MLFYLGTHMPYWLKHVKVPLFISARKLRDRRKSPKAIHRWALDSGGFSELAIHGKWTTPARDYARQVEDWALDSGNMDWAVIQDWPCATPALAKTGLRVIEHQRRSVESLLELRSLSGAKFIAVLQGRTLGEYLRHAEMYEVAGVRLRDESLVGVGSLANRQRGEQAGYMLGRLAAAGLKLHGFGVKTHGLAKYGRVLASADSMAWSRIARSSPPLPGCTHRNCANCLKFALNWRKAVKQAYLSGRCPPPVSRPAPSNP